MAALRAGRPDIVYVHDPSATVALPAMLLKVLRGVPFVYDFQELWPEKLGETCPNSGRASRMVGHFMRVVHRAAAETVVHSQELRSSILANSARPETLTVIPDQRHESLTETHTPSSTGEGEHGDAAAIVDAVGEGITFPYEDAEALAAAVRRTRRVASETRQTMDADAQVDRERLSLQVRVDAIVRVLGRATLSRPRPDAAKRALDIVGSLAALILTVLPITTIAALVRFRLGSPAVFQQERPGRGGKPFTLYKFRTMTDARGANGELLPDRKRLSPFGERLRKGSLDELPELWNVLKGDMSLVGPRPLLTRYSEFFSEEERLRLLVRPGITGWAQVNGRNTASWDDRLALDAWYVRNRSLRLDLRIVALTLIRVLRGSGVVVDPESTMQNLDDARRQEGKAT